MFLSVEEVLLFHQDQISRYGGEPGVRDMGLLESSVAVPASGIGRASSLCFQRLFGSFSFLCILS
jgi:hypothetical protein